MCLFHKWEKIEKGFQFCEKCGKARRIKCSHVWENYGKPYVILNRFFREQDVLLQRCKNCGVLIQFNITKGEYSYPFLLPLE